MKRLAIIMVMCSISIAYSNVPKAPLAKVQTISMGPSHIITGLTYEKGSDTIDLARLYRRKHSRIKYQLEFRTKRGTGIA